MLTSSPLEVEVGAVLGIIEFCCRWAAYSPPAAAALDDDDEGGGGTVENAVEMRVPLKLKLGAAPRSTLVPPPDALASAPCRSKSPKQRYPSSCMMEALGTISSRRPASTRAESCSASITVVHKQAWRGKCMRHEGGVLHSEYKGCLRATAAHSCQPSSQSICDAAL